MKSYLLILLGLLGMAAYSQQTQGFEIPNYAAKTPEAASFLKYGEYPVDLSTGVPGISIPLYTVEGKGIQVPITLNYHASGIKVTQESTWVGLGWNLNFGAQIILNVRDGVDEGNAMIDQIPSDTSIDYYNQHPWDFAQGPQVSEQWDKSRVKDVYQLSSPTANGQFYIRNAANNDIVVYPPNAFKVEFATNTDMLGAKFKVTDTQGNVYLFKTFEKSVREFTHQDFFTSAWYVDEIRTSLKDIISFTYEDDGILEEYDQTQSINILTNIEKCECPGWQTTTAINPIVTAGGSTFLYSKKIKEILFNAGNSKVIFERQSGREDLVNGNSLLKFLQIKQKNSSTGEFDLVRSYGFNYSYFNSNYTGSDAYKWKRLKLDSVQTLPSEETHAFIYSDLQLPSKVSFSRDYFGYFNGAQNSNLIPQTVIADPYPLTIGSADRSVNPNKNQAGILTEVHFPTKGWTKFNYETNQYWGTSTYTSIKSPGCTVWGTGSGNSNPVITPCPDEDGYCCTNPPNCIVYSTTNFSSNLGASVTATINVYNNVNDDDTEIKYQYIRFKVFMGGQLVFDSGKKNKNQQLSYTFSFPAGSGYIIGEAWGEHVHGNINFSFNDSETTEGNINSAGLRVASVENYNDNAALISKKGYDYSIPSESVKSSGRLLNSEPNNYTTNLVYDFTLFHLCGDGISTGGGITPAIDYNKSYSYTSNSRYGIEGNTVTYEYVKEYDVNILNNSINGYTLNKFSFGTDWILDPSIQISMPWNRGKLLEKTVYKNGLANFLTKEVNTYFEDQSRASYISGFKRIRRKILNLTEDNYEFYADLNACGIPQNFYQANIVHKYNIPVYWQYLQSTQVTENIFDSSNQLTGTVVTTKTYSYNNSTHLQLSSEAIVNSLGETSETKYFYPGDAEVSSAANVSGLTQKNILTALKIQSFRAGNKLTERNTVFKNWGTTTEQLYLPELIQGAKGTGTLETRIRFVKVDPNNGNIQQVKQENGTDVSYIWGYNGVYPIAKIENTAYTSISSSLITAAQNASLGTDENALRVALKAIRDSLPNAMVTSYTYRPLIGVSSVTDPKGDTTYYIYDNQGRLTSVKDHFQRVISENTYHFKP